MGYYYADYERFPPYVPVAERRRQADKQMATLRKKGQRVTPVVISGRTIASTFWGKAWCDNLEAYSDYDNRLPRGRTYVRNGSVVDLQIDAGQVTARVMGSQLYRVQIRISPLAAAQWRALSKECSGKIDSLIGLLQGKLSQGVMEVITRPGKGLFPSPQHIKLSCSCPDSASMCKHVAAALYGVGARLDQEPELLFRLRQVDHLQLITQASIGHPLGQAASSAKAKQLAGEDLSALFGIDLDLGESAGKRETVDAKVPPKAAQKQPKAPPKAAKAPPKAAQKQAPLARTRMTRQELLAGGLSPSTLQTWLRIGLLLPSGERGIYKTTASARKVLAERA